MITKKRLSEVGKVEIIIDEEVERFKKILNRQRIEWLIGLFYEHGSRVRAREDKRALRYIEQGKDPKVVLEAFSHAVISKTLYLPAKVFRDFVAMKDENSGICACDGDNCAFIDFFIDELEKELHPRPEGQRSRASSKGVEEGGVPKRGGTCPRCGTR